MVHAVVFAEGQAGVAAVHRTAGGIHQVLHPVVAAALEHVAEAHQVGLDVGGGGQGLAVGRLAAEGGLQGGAILQAGLDQGEGGAAAGGQLLQLGQSRALEGGVVVGIEVVEAEHGRAALQQTLAEMKADEAGGAGNQNRHSVARASVGVAPAFHDKRSRAAPWWRPSGCRG
jgi:hypothetical protein